MPIISPGLTETNLLGNTIKQIDWLFKVFDASDTRYNWSMRDIGLTELTGDLIELESGDEIESGDVFDGGGNITAGENAYDFKVIKFDGLRIRRPSAENRIMSPSNVFFDVSNKDNVLTASDFIGGRVWIHESISDGISAWSARKNRFVIKDCIALEQRLRFECEDYLQNLLRVGDYPNTDYVKDLFANKEPDPDDKVCVPETYGTAYVPLRSAFVDGMNSTGAISTVSFVASALGNYAEIRDSGNGLAIFEPNRRITVSGAAQSANNGSFHVFGPVAAGVLMISQAAGIVAEGTGATVTITQGSRVYLLGPTGLTYNVDKIRSPDGKKTEWPSLNWLLSSSGTGEYYAVSQTGADPSLPEPKDAFGIPRLSLNNIEAAVGTLGALVAGEWAYGDNDALGYDTVYVRLSDSTDPDTKAGNYVSIDYEFSQETVTDDDSNTWVGFQAIIADQDGDGVADAPGIWEDKNGSMFDAPVKFSRSDTVNVTNPSPVISQVLQNIGIPADDLGDTFGTSETTFDNYTVPLEFNGGFWRKMTRTQAVSMLLTMCGSILSSEEKIELRPFEKAAVKTLHGGIDLTGTGYDWELSASGTNEYYAVSSDSGGGDPSLPEPSTVEELQRFAVRGFRGELNAGEWDYDDNDALGYDTIYFRLTDGADPDTKASKYLYAPSDILKPRVKSPSSFVQRPVTNKPDADAGTIQWSGIDDPQTEPGELAIPISGSVTKRSGEILPLPFLKDSRDAQQAGLIHYTFKLGKIGEAIFQSKATMTLMLPNDVLAVGNDKYGGTYDVLIEEMRIRTTGKIDFVCGRYL